MKYIKLTQGQLAIVDDDCFERLSANKWCAQWNPDTRSFYAVREKRDKNKKRYTVFMHRVILGLLKGDGKYADHINHNTIDNQKSNLRIVSNSQNQMNQKKRKNGSSKFKGVCWDKRAGKWRSKIKLNGKTKHLGFFDDEREAAQAYDTAAIEYFGEYAYTNTLSS